MRCCRNKMTPANMCKDDGFPVSFSRCACYFTAGRVAGHDRQFLRVPTTKKKTTGSIQKSGRSIANNTAHLTIDWLTKWVFLDSTTLIFSLFLLATFNKELIGHKELLTSSSLVVPNNQSCRPLHLLSDE